MATRPLLTKDQECEHCGRVTEHKVALEREVEVVARCTVCGRRPPSQTPAPCFGDRWGAYPRPANTVDPESK